ncbi:response regulator receiver [Thermosipho africanus H17ap60334]|jgi:DNA-binding response OmpR family regulator|uniref:response regulator transcription factor n=1 Tax=Thermosipho TaxID=2420 RepID=UPI00028D4FB7|nr:MULTISPECIES: response regulator transcription factor [Thermosipho]MDN5346263.1 two-component system, OmpR family, response regulator [Petrotoga sp.]EKF49334.1 response regulator receiver [Thermosipho africanus H17ap60334]MBZ4649553.1 response regulator receiver [Thermosipho sp. (in: thermotogales)]MDK2838781.1 two-component system, OmpR family, response regulator [Thermosipho sp. (in: thermotogales)]MDK2900739.1 two-component system, OmpR family, response regulator [Thermosipho sp. (in: th
MKILVVEDDDKLRRLLELEFKHENCTVKTCEYGEDAIIEYQEFKPDVVVLDIMLPDIDGTEVAKKIRKLDPSAGIIMLTALSEKKNKLEGFESGADDYVVKPFDFEELFARVKAIARRKNITLNDEIKIKDLIINISKREAKFKGKPINLSKTEFDLLAYLVKNAGRVVSKEEILDAVWGISYEGSENTVEVYINYLRKKLSSDIIKTVRGIGYTIS